MRHAACSMRQCDINYERLHATCDMRHATCSMQTCNHANMRKKTRHAACDMQHAKYDIYGYEHLHATCKHANMQTCLHATFDTHIHECLHATCDMRHATCDMRHATCDGSSRFMRIIVRYASEDIYAQHRSCCAGVVAIRRRAAPPRDMLGAVRQRPRGSWLPSSTPSGLLHICRCARLQARAHAHARV